MRQQLRLRVFLPVVLVALLGAGSFAYATGRPPADEPPPLPPPGATAQTEESAAPERRKAVAANVWTKRMEALCAEANGDLLHTVAELRATDDADAYLVAVVDVHRWLQPELADLGWPKGKKAAVAALRADLERSARVARAGLKAFDAGNLGRLEELLPKAEALDARVRASLRRLGAEKCLDVSEAGASKAEKARPTSPPKTVLARALSRYRVAVVVFYTPGGGVDNVAIREARAAAVELDAGFVALNVELNGTVAKVARNYEVFEAPAVLVVERGPKVATRFDGYADRETVAQAVADALR